MNKLWNVGWGTISNCNMNCQFCYSRSKRDVNNDLILKDWLEFIDTNHNYIGSINYGTGENTLSADWFYFVDYVRANYPKIRQALTTNGYVSEAIKCDTKKFEIINRAIDEIDISLDFSDKKRHNAFRGQEYAFDWAMDTLLFCQKNQKSATIVFLGSKQNTSIDNLNGIFEIARDYNAMIRMNIYRPVEGIDDISRNFILPPKELVDILYWINENHIILSIDDALFSSLFTDSFNADPSGCDSLRILPDGRVTPSTYLIQDEYIVGNIKENDILHRLQENNIMKNIIREKIPEECKDCRYVSTCKGGVYDRRYLWNKTLEKKDPYCFYQPGENNWKKITVSSLPLNSIHHGYLPTMFFLPNSK